MAITRPIWRWRARDLSLDATGPSGAIAGTCVRAATATWTDSGANTVTIPQQHPRFGLSAETQTVYAPGVATTDYLQWTLGILPTAVTFYVRLVNGGTPAATVAIMGLSTANPALGLTQTTARAYSWLHHNGTSSVTSDSAAVTSGHTVELRCVLRSTGVVQIYTSTGATVAAIGSETAATASATLALNATAWSNTSLRLAGGVTGNSPADTILAAAVFLGEVDRTTCRAIL